MSNNSNNEDNKIAIRYYMNISYKNRWKEKNSRYWSIIIIPLACWLCSPNITKRKTKQKNKPSFLNARLQPTNRCIEALKYIFMVINRFNVARFAYAFYHHHHNNNKSCICLIRLLIPSPMHRKQQTKSHSNCAACSL